MAEPLLATGILQKRLAAESLDAVFLVMTFHCLPQPQRVIEETTRMLVGAVIAEWTGASSGLGRVMWLAYSSLNLPPMFAAIFVLSLSGMGAYGLIVWLEKKGLRRKNQEEF